MGFNPGNIVTFDQVEPQERAYVWPGYILAADVTTWIADGGIGKSSVTIAYGARVSAGLPNPPEDPADPYSDPETWNVPGYVIIANLENDADMDIAPQLIAHGADPRYIIDLSQVSIDSPTGSVSDAFSLPRDLGYLERVIRHFSNPENDDVLPGGVRVVFIDPFMSAVTTGTSGNAALRRQILVPLREVAKNTGVGIVLVCHFHKGSKSANARNGNLIDYVGGSKGLTDFCRLNIAMVKDDSTGVVRMFALKSNVGSEDALAYMIKVENGVARVKWGQPRNRAGDVGNRLEARIMRTLQNRADAGALPLNPVQLAALLDLSHREVIRALAHLAKDGRATSGRLGWLPAPALTA